MVSVDDIRDAAERLAPILRKTTVEHVHAVSALVGRDLWVKEEQLQRTGSFKIRGAYNMISRLAEGTPVVAASAGNHAQAVALACSLTGHTCDIYMPSRAPLPRLETTTSYGANVIIVDGDIEACIAEASSRQDGGAAFIPIFDHPLVIAGSGTLGLELASELPEDIETVVVPVGGGGLISGVATALKALRPKIRVVGVEAAGAAAMSRSLREGFPVRLAEMSTLADAIATPQVSRLTLDHVKQYVDDIVLVTDGELSHALLVLLERAKAVIEPGAAASLAAVMAGEVAGNGSVCSILTGGNVDPVLLVKLIDHGLTSSGRFLVLRVVIPDNPGHLAKITGLVSDMNINVVDIEHHRQGHFIEADQVQLDMTLETRNRRQQDQIVEALMAAGYQVDILS